MLLNNREHVVFPATDWLQVSKPVGVQTPKQCDENVIQWIKKETYIYFLAQG